MPCGTCRRAGFLLEKNKVVATKNNASYNNKKAKVADYICTTIDWYTWSTWGEGNDWNCHYDRSETSCEWVPGNQNNFDYVDPNNCSCSGYDGGGGGGAGDGQAELAQFGSQFSETSEIVSIDNIFESSENRTKVYKITVLTGIGGIVNVVSTETGRHKKVEGQWRWESLEHNDISVIGQAFGGTVEVSKTAAYSEVGIFWAGMDLYFNVKKSIAVEGSPFSSSTNYNNKHYWHVEH